MSLDPGFMNEYYREQGVDQTAPGVWNPTTGQYNPDRPKGNAAASPGRESAGQQRKRKAAGENYDNATGGGGQETARGKIKPRTDALGTTGQGGRQSTRQATLLGSVGTSGEKSLLGQ